jgi:membrane protein implicated in regulation of membrane protease activity
METIMALGAWNWMILAAILFVLELTAPGIFFM